MWQHALALLLPSTCLCCESDIAVGAKPELGLCFPCYQDIRWRSGLEYLEDSSLDALFAAGEFSDGLRDAIIHFKYHRRDYLAEELALHWLSRSAYGPDDYDVIVPIPMVPFKSLVRGYNPAAEIAAVIAREHGRPLLTGILRRRLFSISQTDKNKVDRVQNAKRGFALDSNASRITNLSVLLVDDVCTTGATLDVCAKLLKSAGARYVLGAAAARDMLA